MKATLFRTSGAVLLEGAPEEIAQAIKALEVSEFSYAVEPLVAKDACLSGCDFPLAWISNPSKPLACRRCGRIPGAIDSFTVTTT